MDSKGIRILEGLGYVTAILTGASYILREAVPKIRDVPVVGAMLFAIVAVRLVAIAAHDRGVSEAGDQGAEPAEEGSEEKTN